MTIYPFAKLLIKIAYWALVYFIFVPTAKQKNRNRFGWFVMGLISFPVPVIFAIAGCNLWCIYDPQNTFAVVCSNYAGGIGALIGVALFTLLAKKLRSLPAVDAGSNKSLHGSGPQ